MFNRGKKSFSWEKVKFQRYRAEKMLEIWGNKRVTLRKLRGLVTSQSILHVLDRLNTTFTPRSIVLARPNGLLVLCTTLAPEEHVLARPNVLLVLCTTLALEKHVLARPNVLLGLCTTLALEDHILARLHPLLVCVQLL